jgi:hypothetical protein
VGNNPVNYNDPHELAAQGPLGVQFASQNKDYTSGGQVYLADAGTTVSDAGREPIGGQQVSCGQRLCSQIGAAPGPLEVLDLVGTAASAFVGSGSSNLIRGTSIANTITGANAAKGIATFADEAKLISHFEKHGAEFGAKSASEYLQVGQDIMQYGQKVEYLYKGETRAGFVQFMGNKASGKSKFGFVGTNADGAITTIHTESGNSFWKMLNNGNIDKLIRPVP